MISRRKEKKYRKSIKGKRIVGRIKHDCCIKSYGITLEQYDEMFEAQDRVCAICSGVNVGRRLCIDHNHKTGKVRKLLCVSCNAKLGIVEDREFVKKAQKYLNDNS